MTSRFFALTALVALAVLLPIQTEAAQIGAGDFGPGTQTTTFDGLGLPLVNADPLVVDGHTVTTDDGTFRYFGIPSLCISNECVGNNTDRGFIDIVLDNPYAKVGAYVTGGFPGWVIRAEFFDQSDSVVGTFLLSNPSGAGPLFGGWEDAGGIARVRFTDLVPDNRIEALDDLMVETVIPEPSTALLLASGLLGFRVMRGRTLFGAR